MVNRRCRADYGLIRRWLISVRRNYFLPSFLPNILKNIQKSEQNRVRSDVNRMLYAIGNNQFFYPH